MSRYCLVRNPALERWYGDGKHATPFSPLYDVEEQDDDRTPIRVIAGGLPAERAKEIAEKYNARATKP